MRVRGLLVLMLVFSMGCAQLKARSAFSRGEKARAAGDTSAAIGAYEEAFAADPKPQYREALTNVRQEAVASRAAAARDADARGDHAEAAKQWAAAKEFDPDNEELSARHSLAVLRTQQTDPVEYFKAAKRLAALLPDDQDAQIELAEARKEALFYHLRLASVYAAAKSWTLAHKEYEIAREIQPDHAAFSGTSYRRTAAQHHEAEGDRLLASGDALAAYQSFERANELVSSQRIAAKMRRAKKGAGSILEQLSEAETYERLAKWEDAAEIYSLVAGRKDASADVREKARVARQKSANLRAERAKAYAERNLPAKAIAELSNALDHTDGPIDAVTAARSAVDELLADRPGLAHQHFETAKRSPGPKLAVIQVMPIVLAAVAQRTYEKARSTADPAEALVALRRLAPFAASLDGYEAQKNKLRKRAFGALLERARERANLSSYDGAAELLATALDISKPPAKLADALQRATKAMNERDYASAYASFMMARDSDPKSKLASVGYDVARSARLQALRRDADEARVVEDAVRASTAYRGILDIEPNDTSARLGLDELRADIVAGAISNAKAHEVAGRDGAAFVYYRRVLSLDPENAVAKPAASALQAKLDGGGGGGLYVTPTIRGNHLGQSCPNIETMLRDRLRLYLDRTKDIGIGVLDSAAHDEVDQEKRAKPPVMLRTAVEACDVAGASGTARVTFQLLMGSKVLAQQSIDGEFDPASVPKDELADGLPPDRVMSDVVGSAAKNVVQIVKGQKQGLEGWRAMEARASLEANDADRVARAYAGLVSKNGDKTSDERTALEEIERFLNNRYR